MWAELQPYSYGDNMSSLEICKKYQRAMLSGRSFLDVEVQSSCRDATREKRLNTGEEAYTT